MTSEQDSDSPPSSDASAAPEKKPAAKPKKKAASGSSGSSGSSAGGGASTKALHDEIARLEAELHEARRNLQKGSRREQDLTNERVYAHA